MIDLKKMYNKQVGKMVMQRMRRLSSEKERKIARLRFAVVGKQSSLSEIAKVMDMTKQGVHWYERRILAKIFQ